MENCIVAVATALQPAGVGIVRLSGKNSVEIASKFFKSSKKIQTLKGYEAAYGRIYDGDFFLDDGVVLVFKAPKSYTGEDVVEISCHGSLLILEKILKLCIKNGAELATRGEFTKRAFLNKKLSLTQAESVMELVYAQSTAHLKAISTVKDGSLYKKVKKSLDVLVDVAAKIAVCLDYPEEDFDEFDLKKIYDQIEKEKQAMEKILKSQKFSSIVKNGVNIILIGRPNVGKSTLMNLLCGEEKSIVSSIEGTTRDVVEGSFEIQGIRYNIFDVAGIRESLEIVEKIGVEKALKKLEISDIALFVVDDTSEEADIKILSKFDLSKTILVYNKSDLNYIEKNFSDYNFFTKVKTSNRDLNSIENLKNAIASINLNDIEKFKDYFIMLNERQKTNIENSVFTLEKALKLIKTGEAVDVLGVVLEQAVDFLLQLTGEKVSDLVIDDIFSKFCVGK